MVMANGEEDGQLVNEQGVPGQEEGAAPAAGGALLRGRPGAAEGLEGAGITFLFVLLCIGMEQERSHVSRATACPRGPAASAGQGCGSGVLGPQEGYLVVEQKQLATGQCRVPWTCPSPATTPAPKGSRWSRLDVATSQRPGARSAGPPPEGLL